MADRQDRMDTWLDDALMTYSEAPETEGLEQRILARVAESKPRTRPRSGFRIALAAALVLASVGLFWLVTAKSRTEPERAQNIASTNSELSRLRAKPAPASPPILATTVNTPKLQKKSAAPKRPRFPTPSPLTREERALIQLVTGNAEYIPKTLTRFGSPIEPIEITAIEIKPLQLVWNTKEEHAAINRDAGFSGGNDSAVLDAK